MWDGDQRRGFGEREGAGGFIEIDPRGGVNAVGQVSVVIGVEIPFQDFFFGVQARQFNGDQDLFDLAAVALHISLFQRDDGVLDHLLRDRRGALHRQTLQVVDERAGQTARVKARVGPEAAIFHRHGAARHVLGNFRIADPVPVAGVGVNHLVEQILPRTIVDLGRLEGLDAGGGHFVGGGQSCRDGAISGGCGPDYQAYRQGRR